MRVLVVNPVGHSKWDEQDKRIYQSFASQDTIVDVVSLPHGPPSVETPEAHAEVIPLVVKRVLEFKDKYDGFIVNCFLDPGVNLLKGLIEKPVVGPCEASMALASMVSSKIGIVTVGNEALWMIEEHVRELGFGDRLVALEGIELGVLDIDKDIELTVKKLVEASRRALEKGAEVIVLGCTGLAGLAEKVEREIGVPVIDPSGAAIKVLEALVKLRVRNPKATARRK